MERKLIMKVIIVGGVAGGASCAARLRRLDEKAEILMVERGPYVSYANCGLPYHISGVIEKEASLMVANAPLFKVQFAIEARTNCEATAVSPKNKTVDLRDVTTGAVTTESYDKLVLSPGALSIRPPLPGIDLPGIFQVRTVPDARTIRQWIVKGTDFLEGIAQQVEEALVGADDVALQVKLDDGLGLLDRIDDIQRALGAKEIEHQRFPWSRSGVSIRQ